MVGKVKLDDSIEEVQVVEEDAVVRKVKSQDPKDEKREEKVEKSYRLFWTILSAVEILLFIRFLLEFLEANPNSPFFIFIRVVTAPLMMPFFGLFEDFDVTFFDVEVNTLFAMFIYFLISFIVVRLLEFFKPVEN